MKPSKVIFNKGVRAVAFDIQVATSVRGKREEMKEMPAGFSWFNTSPLNPSFHFRNRAVYLVCKLAFMSIPIKDSTNFLSSKQRTGKVPRFKSFVLIAGHLNLQPTLLFKEGENGLFVFLTILWSAGYHSRAIGNPRYGD
jgi:hypothetical protein